MRISKWLNELRSHVLIILITYVQIQMFGVSVWDKNIKNENRQFEADHWS